MRTDVTYSHSKNIGEPIGHDFCGVPIRSYDRFDLELDHALAVQRTVLCNQATGINFPNTAEILPGEVLCSDNIVRRVTTAEAIGYDVYKETEPATYITGNGGFAYSPEENRWTREGGNVGQSTPEEMCAWLNAQEKCSFTYEVKTEGEDKILLAKDAGDTLLYAFRYVGGLPGTYIGGGEIRSFEPPQIERGAGTDSRVVECIVPAPERPYREPVDLKEWADEWKSNYAPTSHLERLTIGGTAMFDLDDLRKEIDLSKVAAEPEITLTKSQTCEWYPDGEKICGELITHPHTPQQVGTCDACFAAREARVD